MEPEDAGLTYKPPPPATTPEEALAQGIKPRALVEYNIGGTVMLRIGFDLSIAVRPGWEAFFGLALGPLTVRVVPLEDDDDEA